MKFKKLLSTHGALFLAVTGAMLLVGSDALLNQNGVFTHFIWGSLLNLTVGLFFITIISTITFLFFFISRLDLFRESEELFNAVNNYVKFTGINSLFLMFTGGLFGIMTAYSSVTGVPFMRIICNFFAVLPSLYFVIVNIDNVVLIVISQIYFKLHEKNIQN